MDEVEVGDELLVEAGDLEESQNGSDGTRPGTLLTREEGAEYRARWQSIQASFIDEPRKAVEQADNLVDRVVNHLTEGLAEERDLLVRRWDHGAEPVSTEELRLALQGYRKLLDRLLTVSL